MLPIMADDLSPQEAADLLATTAPTIRRLVKVGSLEARVEQHGQRTWIRVERTSVDAYLRTHGAFERATSAARLAKLESRVESFARANAIPAPRGREVAALERETADLRARASRLEAALARVRTASDLQREADRRRAEMLEHLQKAIRAGQAADEFRLRAIEELESAVSSSALIS